MRRALSAMLLAFPILSLLFVLFVLLFSGLGKVSDSTLKDREQKLFELEQRAAEKTDQALYCQNAEQEYSAFRERYLIRLDRFGEIRKSLGEMIRRQGLGHSGLQYANRNSPDGKVILVRFSFGVSGSYGQIRRLIWDLEHLPHVARIGKAVMRKNDKGAVQCLMELEVIFEK